MSPSAERPAPEAHRERGTGRPVPQDLPRCDGPAQTGRDLAHPVLPQRQGPPGSDGAHRRDPGPPPAREASRGSAESRCRGLARGSGGVAPSGPSPSRRPGRNQAYPTSAGRGNQPCSVLTVSSSEFRTFRSSTTICAEPGRPAARPVTMTSWKADCASGIGPTARSRQRGGTGSDMICKQTPRKAALQTRGHRAHVSRAPAPAFSRLASSTDLQLGVRGTSGGARLGQEEFMNFAVPL
jgi:hypothetical protein